MYRRGFTIIELLVVIVLMGILLTLGVVNLRSSQVNARDEARKQDVSNIVLALETYYTNGSLTGGTPGSYPPTALSDSTNTVIEATLPDLDAKSLEAPGISDPTKSFISATCTGTGSICVQSPAGVTSANSPAVDINHFVYQPLQQSGALCTLYTQNCQKFNLFYETETTSTVIMVTSKNQ
jgi:prepilin-type N-terminal cleavage/methylation domain-containing protein